MVSATGDWTRNTPKEEFPAVRDIYKLLDAEQNVESVQIDQMHNYSKEPRDQLRLVTPERNNYRAHRLLLSEG